MQNDCASVSTYDLFCLLLDLPTDEKLMLEFMEQEVNNKREISGSQIEIEDFVNFMNQPMGRRRFNPSHPIVTSAERDSAVAEREEILSSTIWKFFGPYRKLIQFIRKI